MTQQTFTNSSQPTTKSSDDYAPEIPIIAPPSVENSVSEQDVGNCAGLTPPPFEYIGDGKQDFLAPDDLENHAYLGSSVFAIATDKMGIVVAGAPGANAVYLFVYDNPNFLNSAKIIRINLSSGNQNDIYYGKAGRFGHVVEMDYLNDELHLLITDPFYDGKAGATFVMKVDDALNQNKALLSLMDIAHVIIKGSALDEFGYSAKLKDNIVAIGVPGGDFGLTRNSGEVAIVTADAIINSFAQFSVNNQKILNNNNINVEYFTLADQYYGSAIDIKNMDGSYYIAMAGLSSAKQCVSSVKFTPNKNENNYNGDITRIYEKCINTGTNFGYSLAYIGDKLCVGEPGFNNYAGRVVCNSAIDPTNFNNELMRGDASFDYNGAVISYSNNVTAIGSPGEGTVTIFNNQDSYEWKVTGQDQTYFGSAVYSLVVNGKKITIIGAPYLNTRGISGLCDRKDTGGIAVWDSFYYPTSRPTFMPSVQPTAVPSGSPTVQPSGLPSSQPTSSPTSQPSSFPTSEPAAIPSVQPSSFPSSQPTCSPTSQPSACPSVFPTVKPSAQPSSFPSFQPSDQPSSQPSSFPTVRPTRIPSGQPSTIPTSMPSSQPTGKPSGKPSVIPTNQPTSVPSSQPTGIPTVQPTLKPSSQPSSMPSALPSMQPTVVPSGQPSSNPSVHPTTVPSSQPSSKPSSVPSIQPSSVPSSNPSVQPSAYPTAFPSSIPTKFPTGQPSGLPSVKPTLQPSSLPTAYPSSSPSVQPSAQPSISPSALPSAQPSAQPSSVPTSAPTKEDICHIVDPSDPNNPYGIKLSCSRLKELFAIVTALSFNIDLLIKIAYDIIPSLAKLLLKSDEIEEQNNLLIKDFQEMKKGVQVVNDKLDNLDQSKPILIINPRFWDNENFCFVDSQYLDIVVQSTFKQTGNNTCILRCVDKNNNTIAELPPVSKDFLMTNGNSILVGMCDGGIENA